MKSFIGVLIFIFSVSGLAATKVECSAETYKFVIQSHSSSDIQVSYLGETVRADGYLDNTEVDFVARFKSIGEMTLFAKRGKTGPDSYVFIKGRRISVYCN